MNFYIKGYGMKKILIAVAALILVLLVAVYVVLFTSFGNKIVAGIIEDKAKQAGLELNVSKFVLRFSSLDIDINVANMLNAKVEGNLSLFKLGFDIDYNLAVNTDYVKNLDSNLTSMLNLPKNLSFGGKVAGKASDFKADGRGYLFGSNVILDAHIVDYSPLALKLSANGIKLEELLDLVSQPRYLAGVLNVNADISAKDLKPDGKASINLYTSSINYKLLQKDMNLTLPAGTELTADIIANVSGSNVLATTNIKNSYLNLTAPNTHYDLEKGVLNSDFNFKVPDLSKLKALVGTNIRGTLNLDGNASVTGANLNELNAKLVGNGVSAAGLPNMNLTLNAKAQGEGDKINFDALLNSNLFKITQLNGFYKMSNSELNAQTALSVDDLSKFSAMAGTAIKGSAKASASAHLIGAEIKKLKADADIAGGTIAANSDGKTLDFAINNLDIAKLLAIVAQPAYASGAINAKAHLSSIDVANLNGTFEANAGGVLNQAVLSKLLEKKFPANSKYSFKLNGDIKSSVANFAANATTDFVNLSSLKGSFNIKNTTMQSNFVIDAFDFSKLNWLAERKLTGRAVFNGTANLDNKGLNAKITSDDIFQGKLNATLANNVLDANLNNVDFSTLMKGVDLPDYYDVKASVKANYNLTTSNGVVDANLANGKLKNVGIIKTLATLTKSDFGKDSFTDGNLNAKLSPNAVALVLALNSPRVSIGVPKGAINTANSTLNLPFTLRVDKAEFKGNINGKTDDPKVSLDMGSVAKAALSNPKVQEQTKKLEEKGKKELNKLLDKLF